MRECMKNFPELLRAQLPCFWIQSFEEAEIIEDIKSIVKNDPRFGSFKIQVWSHSEGVKELPVDNNIRQQPPKAAYREPPALFSLISASVKGGKVGSETVSASKNIWILRDIHPVLGQDKTWRAIRDICEYQIKSYNPIVIVSPTLDLPEEISHLFRIIKYDLPDKKLTRSILEQSAKKLAAAAKQAPESGYVAPDAEELNKLEKACSGMTVMQQALAVKESMTVYKKLDLDFLSKNKIEMVKKSGALDYIIPKITLDDVGGNGAIKKWLLEEIQGYDDDAAEFGMDQPKGLMAVGVPGAGKTMLAEALAGHMHVPLLKLSMSKVMDRMVGASEKKIDHALKIAAACAPCVLLLDEAEKAIGGVASSNQSDSGITMRVMSTLIEFMQNNKGVYMFMTSNDISQLPAELTRSDRLDGTWFFGIPTEKERRDIFSIHFANKKRGVSEEVMAAAVANSDGFTGAEVKQAVKNAMRKAFMRYKQDGNKEVTVEDIVDGCSEVTPVVISSRAKMIALDKWCRETQAMDASTGQYKTEADKAAKEDADDDFLGLDLN